VYKDYQTQIKPNNEYRVCRLHVIVLLSGWRDVRTQNYESTMKLNMICIINWNKKLDHWCFRVF